MQVSLFKLTSGEEIIARIAEHDSIHYLLEDPVQMFRQIAPNGMTWIQCSHWLLFSKSSLVEIEKSNVLAIVHDLNDNVIQNYKDFVSVSWQEQQQALQNSKEEQLKMAEEQVEQIISGHVDKPKRTIH
jgi:hypothetical protein|tara:strand:+ start:430 stop:816 length:387 start_codon:yes stop_codon:yes gene_type:complete